MKKWDWLQHILYYLMGILGIYIIYKGSSILLRQNEMQRIVDTGKIQVTLEDAAMRTHFPGYTAVVEQRKNKPWTARWMEPLVPVYSYMAMQQEEDVEELQTDLPVENNMGTQTESAANNLEVQAESASENKFEPQSESVPENSEVPAVSRNISDSLRHQLQDFDYLLNHYYTVDGGTSANEELLDAEQLLAEDLRIWKNAEVPQILIYHTHSQEAFADSEEGNTEHTVIGMGEVLAEELREFGYQVIHDTGVYDLVDGVLDRSAAYDHAREAVQQILKENPTVEVIIDLHRDGVDGKKFVTEIDGKPTSMIMFFNGISRNNQEEPLSWLENPYIQQNLAFSLQLQLKAEQQYPGFTRNIYLKAERFNLHLRPRSLLIEAGTQLNTVEEEQNAMEPLADLICQVLEGR